VRLVRLLVLAATALAMASWPGEASAFPLSPDCDLGALSFRADDSLLDGVDSSADDATQSDPFRVDWDGQVHWTGNTSATVLDNSWHVDVYMLPTPLRGGDPNDDRGKTGNGDITFAANSPFRFTGLYYVSGQFSGDGGSCSGGGWVRLIGNPLATLPFWISLLITALGVVLLVAGLRGAWGWAVLGGLVAGVGLSLILIMFGVVPLGRWTPLASLGLVVLLGVVISLFSYRRSPRAL
jgi:hypothetical protein